MGIVAKQISEGFVFIFTFIRVGVLRAERCVTL